MEVLKLALRNVAEARLGGMSALPERAALNREALCRALSAEGNPTLETLSKVIRAPGLRIAVAAEDVTDRRPEVMP